MILRNRIFLYVFGSLLVAGLLIQVVRNGIESEDKTDQVPLAITPNRYAEARPIDEQPESLPDPPITPTLATEVQSALALTDPDERLQALREILKHLTPGELPDVLAAFEVQLPPTRENAAAYALLLEAWARFAGADAMGYAISRLNGNARLDGGSAAAQSWANQDWNAAANHVRALPHTYGKDYIVYHFVFPSIDRDPNATLQWVYSLPPELLPTASHHALDYWLSKNPRAASDWVIAHADPALETQSIRLAAMHWTRQDLKAADQFVQQLHKPAAQSAAMVAVVEWLAAFQPESVGDWLNRYENSPTLDPALAQFAKSIMHVDPESAATWAQAITDEPTRTAVLNEIEGRPMPETESHLTAQPSYR